MLALPALTLFFRNNLLYTKKLIALICLCSLLPVEASAQTENIQPHSKQLKIGLVLSGGGALVTAQRKGVLFFAAHLILARHIFGG